LAAVQFIEHFVPSALVKIVGDITHARVVIAVDKDANSFQLLSNWVLTARKYIHRQIRPNFGKGMRISQPGGSAQERFCRRGLKYGETQRVLYESIHDPGIAA